MRLVRAGKEIGKGRITPPQRIAQLGSRNLGSRNRGSQMGDPRLALESAVGAKLALSRRYAGPTMEGNLRDGQRISRYSSSALSQGVNVGVYWQISSAEKYRLISRSDASGPSEAWTRFICRLLL